MFVPSVFRRTRKSGATKRGGMLMEFIEMIIRRKSPEDQISIHLVTGPHDGDIQKQRELLDSITEVCIGSGVDFTWAFDTT